MHSFVQALGLVGLAFQSANAITVDLTSQTSIKQAASTVAYGLLKYYTGNNTGDVAGNLPDPYYWWEAGAMFGTLIDYWAYTGDESYNQLTLEAMVHQAGDDKDFMPTNQTRSLGNDDQGFWALSAMTAAEMNFTNPSSDQPQWLALVQAVFNEYIDRWDTATCGGGLRWQIFTFNNGYNYKNSVSNGCFFNIAARLARYTGNETYADWATKIYEWETTIKFISDDFHVLDGAGNAGSDNCSAVNGALFSYNAGLYLHGAAYMYNLTDGSAVWKTRVEGLLTTIGTTFFKDGIMFEQICEDAATCNTDQESFKGLLSRWMAMTAKIAPFTSTTIMAMLKTSAAAAALQCSGSPSTGFNGIAGTACGFSWIKQASFDGLVGVGQQMNALSVIMSPLIDLAPTPYTSDTGGSSQGNVNAGSDDSSKISVARDITTADRAGAGILTMMVLGGLAGGVYFVIQGS